MGRYSVREAIEMAVRTEKLGYRFYTTTAKKFKKNQGLYDLFMNLANMELTHERTFTALLDRIHDAEPSGWEEAGNFLRAIVESEFFLGRGKSLPKAAQVKSVGKAVDFALGFEKETALFFVGIKGFVPKADRYLVDEIIAEEKRHIAYLSEFRAALRGR
jgi:rubrerythrin